MENVEKYEKISNIILSTRKVLGKGKEWLIMSNFTQRKIDERTTAMQEIFSDCKEHRHSETHLLFCRV